MPEPLEETTKETVFNVKGGVTSDHSTVTILRQTTQIVDQAASSFSSTKVTLSSKIDKVIDVTKPEVNESKHLSARINVCPENEEFLPSEMLETVGENTKQTSFYVKKNDVPNQSNITSPRQIHLVDKASGSKVFLRSNNEKVSDVTDSGVIEFIQPDNDLTTSVNGFLNVDLNDCMPSVNIDNLKMLSVLDFAGHSAYYACHHIFFSPRAFFILVVDMTKELSSVATEPCRKEEEDGLIYSKWTYAGKLPLLSLYICMKMFT